MKQSRFLPLIFACVGILAITFSCDDDETYAEMRERENAQIKSFLKNGTKVINDEGEEILNVPGDIKVISESEFYANDSTTDVSKNEYVLFKGSGVYMQIIRKGIGEKLEEGENARIINRYVEFNIGADSISSTNRSLMYETMPEIMTCSNNYGTITASFISGVMSTLYGTNAVPSGWIIPLHFLKLGRQNTEDGEIALVRLIVPSTEGQNDAQYKVYPCFYEISYQKGR